MFNRDVSMDRINRLERNAGISSTAVLVVLLIFLFTTN